MSKHLGVYSQYHGPAGKVLTDYTEANIPALWNSVPERITNIANSGKEYTGVLAGYTPENPLVLTENKLFFFTPHVHNLSSPLLSINGLPLRPILLPGTRTALSANTLAPNGDYVLWYKNAAFELLFDLQNPGSSTPTPPIQTSERIYAFIGQSNVINQLSFPYNVPEGLLEWNWDEDPTTTGTAFSPPSSANISFPRAFAAKILESETHISTVRIIAAAQNGIDISHWLEGLNYQFSTITTIGDPGPGFIRFNNANPDLATALYVSIRDVNNVIKIAAFNLAFDYLKIFTGGSYAEFTLGTQISHTNWLEYPVIPIANSGTIPNLAAVKVKNGLDMREVEDNNFPPALIEANKEHFDRIIWWQGESDSAFPQGYVADFNEVYSRWLTKGYITHSTPITIMGNSSSALTGQPSRDEMNIVLQQIAGDDPDRKKFLNTAEIIPFSQWNEDSPLHPTAEGYNTIGSFLHEAIFAGAGQSTSGVVINPTTEIPLFNNTGFGFTGNPDIGLCYSTGLGGPGISGRGLLTWAVSNNTMQQDIVGGSGVWRLRSEGTTALEIDRYSTDSTAPVLRTVKARGTIAAPEAIASLDNIQLIEATAWDDSAPSAVMRLRTQITDPAPSPTSLGSLFAIQLVRNGASTLADTLIVDPDIGICYGQSSSVLFTPSQHLKRRQYPFTSYPTPAANEEIGSADIVGAPLNSDGTRWISPGVKVLAAIAANTSLSLPANWAIDSIFFVNTTANAVTGGIRLGTSAGAADIVAAQPIAANAIGHIAPASILLRLFSTAGSQTIFIQAVTAWNSASVDLSFMLRKVF